MKKNWILFLVAPLLLFATGCSSDDGGDTGTLPPKELLLGKWAPDKIVPVLPVIGEVAIYAQNYPHQTGCEKDYLELQTHQILKTVQHASNCSTTETVSNWEKNGTSLKIILMNTTVEGILISTEGQSPMILESDASAYQEIIGQLLPGVTLPSGTKIRLYMNKLL